MTMKNPLRSAVLGLSALSAFFLGVESSHAGWSGAMNGLGYGSTSVNVTSSTLAAAKVGSTATNGPTASMVPAAGYTFCAPLPDGASANTVARVKGGPGYVWQASTIGSNGDKTDNLEIEQRVVVRPANCASLTMSSLLPPGAFDPQTGLGAISVITKGTAGTALLLRGFEVPPGTVIPVDDPNTPNNETTDFLKANGLLKFENLMVGPFEYGAACPLTIYFALDNPDLNNFIFTTDGLAKSNPIQVTCPAPATVECGQAYHYPDLSVTGGCGNLIVTYSPAESQLQLGANTVTVTATDEQGDSGSCTFIVTKVDTQRPVISGCPGNIRVNSLPTQCGQNVSWVEPTASDSCSLGSFTADHHPGDFFPVGTTTVTYTAQDASGNVAACSFTVTVDDKTAPVPDLASLPVIQGQCSATVTTTPTATDNCRGQLAGTTTSPRSYTAQGTYTVVWTYNDGNGNIATQNQTVIVADTAPPAAPSLADVNASCGTPVTLTAPPAVDNCSGTVTGRTATAFPITQPGTTVVTWTFTDAAGNSSTANQKVTISGYTFVGFYSPINGSGGTCANIARNVNGGSSVPIKFDFKCGSSYITSTSGTPKPTVKIQRWSSNCAMISEQSFTADYQNDWHVNWDTSSAPKGIYKIIVILPDNSSNYVFINLK